MANAYRFVTDHYPYVGTFMLCIYVCYSLILLCMFRGLYLSRRNLFGSSVAFAFAGFIPASFLIIASLIIIVLSTVSLEAMIPSYVSMIPLSLFSLFACFLSLFFSPFVFSFHSSIAAVCLLLNFILLHIHPSTTAGEKERKEERGRNQT